MSAKQRGSKLDQLYSDGGGSKLDQLYSDGGNSNPEMKAAEMRRKTQNGAYKNALRDTRSKDPNERASGYKRALDMQNQGYQPQVGIPGDGEYDAQDRKYADNHVREGLVLEAQAKKRQEAEFGGKPSPASPQVPSPGGAVTPAGGAENPFINGSGYKSGSEVAAAAPAPHVGQGATAPAATPSAPSGAPVNSKPAATDWRAQRATALEALKGKFSKQDEANALVAKAASQGEGSNSSPKKESPSDDDFNSMKALAAKISSKGEMTPENKAASERDAASVAYGKKAIADATAAEPDLAARKALDEKKTADIEADYQDGLKAVKVVDQSRATDLEDTIRNSEHFLDQTFLNPFRGPERKDAKPNIEMDWDAFDKRDPNDPNFGQKPYESVYGENGEYKGGYRESKQSAAPTFGGVGSPQNSIPRSSSLPKFDLREAVRKKQEEMKTPHKQASNQIKQQKDNFYNGQINSVLEHSSFLQRYAV